MRQSVNDLKAALFAAKDGNAATDAINSLANYAKKGNVPAKQVLAFYVKEGRIDHVRTHACSSLAKAKASLHWANAALLLTTAHGADFQYRANARQMSGYRAVAGVPAPYWLRLRRQGNVFTASISFDGSHWNLVGFTTAA